MIGLFATQYQLNNKIIIMKKIGFLLLLIGSSFTLKAQDFGQIIAGSLQDANKYASDYMRPFGEGEIYNLSRG